jgi:hypothetical protein
MDFGIHAAIRGSSICDYLQTCNPQKRGENALFLFIFACFRLCFSNMKIFKERQFGKETCICKGLTHFLWDLNQSKSKRLKKPFKILFSSIKIFEGLPNVSSVVEVTILKWQQGRELQTEKSKGYCRTMGEVQIVFGNG